MPLDLRAIAARALAAAQIDHDVARRQNTGGALWRRFKGNINEAVTSQTADILDMLGADEKAADFRTIAAGEAPESARTKTAKLAGLAGVVAGYGAPVVLGGAGLKALAYGSRAATAAELAAGAKNTVQVARAGRIAKAAQMALGGEKAGIIRRNVAGALAAAPLQTIPGALADEGASPTRFLAQADVPVLSSAARTAERFGKPGRLAADLLLDAGAGSALEGVTHGAWKGAKAGGSRLLKAVSPEIDAGLDKAMTEGLGESFGGEPASLEPARQEAERQATRSKILAELEAQPSSVPEVAEFRDRLLTRRGQIGELPPKSEPPEGVIPPSGPRGKTISELLRQNRDERLDALAQSLGLAPSNAEGGNPLRAANSGETSIPETTSLSEPPGTQLDEDLSKISGSTLPSPSATARNRSPSLNTGPEVTVPAGVTEPVGRMGSGSVIGAPHVGSGRTIHHTSQDVNEILTWGKERVPQVKADLEAAAANVPGAGQVLAGTKAEPGAVESEGYKRILAKMNNPAKPMPAETLSDLLRGRVILQDPSTEWRALTDGLEEKGYKVIGIDDFSEPGAGSEKRLGYRAVHAQIALPDGSGSFELQIMSPEMADHMERAHVYYNTVRGDYGPLPEAIVKDAEKRARALFQRGADLYELRRSGGRSAAYGRPAQVVLSNGEKIPTRFALLGLDEVQPSHNPMTGARNPAYPEGVQGREYGGETGRAALESVAGGAATLDPARVLDPGNAVEGAPVVTNAGHVVIGNGRAMMIQRAAAAHPERYAAYLADLERNAKALGIDSKELADLVAQGKQPMLVRLVAPGALEEGNAGVLSRINRLSDVTPVKAKEDVSEGIGRAAALASAPRSLDHFAATFPEDGTLRGYLDSADGQTFARGLVADGVISDAERGRVFNPNGSLTREGKNLVETMMYGAALGREAWQLAPDGVLAKLDGSVAALAKSARAEGWDLKDRLTEAMKLIDRAKANDIPLRSLAEQVDFTAEAPDPLTLELAGALLEKPKAELTKIFRGYAAQASTAGETGGVSLFGEAATPDDALASVLAVEGVSRGTVGRPRTGAVGARNLEVKTVGREGVPHITIRGGLSAAELEKLRGIVRSGKPFRYQILNAIGEPIEEGADEITMRSGMAFAGTEPRTARGGFVDTGAMDHAPVPAPEGFRPPARVSPTGTGAVPLLASMTGGGVGAAAGYAAGDTPEERADLAAIGAMAGVGAPLAGSAMLRALEGAGPRSAIAQATLEANVPALRRGAIGDGLGNLKTIDDIRLEVSRLRRKAWMAGPKRGEAMLKQADQLEREIARFEKAASGAGYKAEDVTSALHATDEDLKAGKTSYLKGQGSLFDAPETKAATPAGMAPAPAAPGELDLFGNPVEPPVGRRRWGKVGATEEPLQVTHNAATGNLLQTILNGGELAAPSLAIHPERVPFDQFGEISLIGGKELGDPKRTPIFGADVYSGRVPEVLNNLNAGTIRRLSDRVTAQIPGVKIVRSVGDEADPLAFLRLAASAGKKGKYIIDPVDSLNDFVNSPSARVRFVMDEAGLTPEELEPALTRIRATKAGEEASVSDAKLFELGAQKLGITPTELEQQFVEHGQKILEFILDREKGMGAYRSLDLRGDATADRLARAATRGGVRLGERGFGSDEGVGQLRAILTPQFRTVQGMREASAARLVPRAGEEGSVRQLESEFLRWRKAAGEAGRAAYEAGSGSPLGPSEEAFGRAARTALFEWAKDGAKEGQLIFHLGRRLEPGPPKLAPGEMRIRETPAWMTKLADEGEAFARKLRESKTDYFEGKPKRAVALSEFHGAVIPSTGIPTVDAPGSWLARRLKEFGLEVRTFDALDPATRRQNRLDAIAKLRTELFEKGIPVKFGLAAAAGLTPATSEAQSGDSNANAVQSVLYAGMLAAGGYAVGKAVARSAARRAAEEAVVRSAAHGGLDRAITRSGIPIPHTPPEPKRLRYEEALKEVTGAGIDPDEYVNVAKFALDPTGEKRLRYETAQMVERHGLDPKEVVTHEQTTRAAQALGAEVSSIAGKERLTAPEMLALRKAIRENVEIEVELTKRLNDPQLTEEGRASLEATLSGLAAQNDNYLAKFTAERTRTGRDLNALKILANYTNDPVFWLSKARRTVGGPLTEVQRTKILELLNTNQLGDLSRFVAGMRPSSKWDLGMTLWKAGLLTRPTTHLANTLGNLTMAALETAKDVPATFYDALAGTMSGYRTKELSIPGILEASQRGVIQGIEEAKRAWQGRAMSDRELAKYEIHEVNYDNAFLDKYTKTIFRSLTAADRFFRSIAVERSIQEQAGVIARAEGLEGARHTARVKDLIKSPTDAMALRAIEDAEYATFQDNTPLARAALGLRRPLGPVGELIIPFAKTPANVASRVLEYSPLGTLKTVPHLMKLLDGTFAPADQREIVEALGRVTVGGAALAVGWMLAEHGNLSGNLPQGRTEREAWNLAGKIPNAVLVNGEWRALQRVSPLGNLIALGGAMQREREAGGNVGDVALAGAKNIGATLKDQTFLSGIQSLEDMLRDPKQYGGDWARQMGTSAIPTVLQGAVRAGQGVVKEERGSEFPAVFGSRMGLETGLPTRRDQFGQPVKRPRGVMQELFDPFGSTPDARRTDPMIRELDAVGANIGRLTRRKGESASAFEKRAAMDGRILRSALEALVQSEDYRAIGPAARAQAKSNAEASALAREAKRELIIRETRRIRTALTNERTRSTQP